MNWWIELSRILVGLGLALGLIWSVLVCLVWIAVAVWKINQEVEIIEYENEGQSERF